MDGNATLQFLTANPLKEADPSLLSPHPSVSWGLYLSPVASLLLRVKMDGPGFVFHFYSSIRTVCIYTRQIFVRFVFLLAPLL